MKEQFNLFLVAMLFLPGCSKIVQWGKDSFAQGQKVPDYTVVPREYIRSAIIYDQFKTQALFDVLWLSDEVRNAYVDTHIMRTGKSSEQKELLLRRELEENNHYVTFYVLSLHSISLIDPQPLWITSLKVDDEVYQPVEIKYIDISPEYILFFGKKMSGFKVAYQLKFDAHTVDGDPILSEGDHILKLYFRSPEKELYVTWKLYVADDDVVTLKKKQKPLVVRHKKNDRRV